MATLLLVMGVKETAYMQRGGNSVCRIRLDRGRKWSRGLDYAVLGWAKFAWAGGWVGWTILV